MNPVSPHPDWLSLVGLITLEVTVMVGIAAILHCLTRTAIVRRTIWHVCLLGLTGLVVFELTGVARGLAGWFGSIPHAQPAMSGPAHIAAPELASETLLLSEDFRRQVSARVAANQQTHAVESSRPEAPEQAPVASLVAGATQMPGTSQDFRIRTRQPAQVETGAAGRVNHGWVGAAWLLGAAAILFRVVLGRLLFIAFRWRRQTECDRPLHDRVQELARRVGIRRRVRVLELSKLPGPIAFGILRPTIGLPSGFHRSFDALQQDAMIAHELAHLAVHDPAWGILADAVVAAFWWHPLVWWARRQLCAANEAAADEASLLIVDGPNVLAECLVELGNRLSRSQSFGWLAIGGNGYRSALGNRVQRLLELTGRSWRPPNRFRSGLANTIGPIALLTAVVLCTAGTHRSVLNEGDTPMKLIDQNWRKSVVAFALAATLGTDTRAALANDEETNSAKTAKRTTAKSQESDSADKTSPQEILTQQDAVRNLEAFILAKQKYDAGKLAEAEQLLREAVKRDPASQAVAEFLKKIEASEPGLRSNDETSAETAVPKGPAENRPVLNSVQLDPKMAARYGLRADNSSPKARAVETNYFIASGKDRPSRRAVESKLDQITFDESPAFDGLPLSEVVKNIDDEARKRDPEKRGINFIISNSPDASSGAVDPLTGQPIPAEPVDLNNVIIKLNALRNVRLRDILDALTKVASNPIQFSVEDYGVVFSRSSTSSVSSASTEETPKMFWDQQMAERYGLSSVDQRMIERYPGSKPTSMAQRMVERYGLTPPATNSPGTGPAPSEKGRHAVQTRLEQITFDELPRFDGVPLGEVIRNLDDEVRKRDPEKHGINFILSNSLDAPQPSSAIDPNTGLPVPVEPVDLNSVTIRLAALRHVRLKDVLDAITKVADHPIKYTVEEYGVVLSRKVTSPDIGPAQLAPAGPLQVRTYHVDTNTFLKGLESAFGIAVSELTGKSATQSALRRFLVQLGVNMDSPGKAIFYNDITGVLMVRATADDLVIVQAAIETLAGRAAGQDDPIPGAGAGQNGFRGSAEKRPTVSVFGALRKPGLIDLPQGREWSAVDPWAAAEDLSELGPKRIELKRRPLALQMDGNH